ncbi:MAG: alpha/beta hydrolase domain-containing protein [Acidimicrobiia bacterium]|nr:alpha/beta hydrolase domain-containing protein [Acidimicrobiia bacterium]
MSAARAVAALLIGVVVVSCGGPDGESGNSTVTGPVTGGSHGFPATSAPVDLAADGYVEEEFFLEGTATSYEPSGTWSADGVWPVVEHSSAPYKTRLLVRRPTDPDRFNGTVVVEWFNVTSNIDLDPDFGFASEEILREGYAWVGVTAQAVGITSTGGSPLGDAVVGLQAWDPERYGSLDHPGDSYSYDIFSQAGEALVSPDGVDLLGGLEPERLIADGESQSAYRMLTYVNAIHPESAVYDGFLIHSRNGSGAPLGDGLVGGVPTPAQVRADSTTPVFQVLTETDLFSLGEADAAFPGARQPDTDVVHTWELAGTAHADAHYLEALLSQGRRQYDDFIDLTPILGVVNTAPQYVAVNAALHALDSWIREGTPPGTAPPIETRDGAIARDSDGNALGGLRLPHVEVPVAMLSGEGDIPLSGQTIPFDEARLHQLYPDHDTYVQQVEAAAARSVDAGYLLPADAEVLVADARASDIGT